MFNWIVKTVLKSLLIVILPLFPGDSARAFRLRLWWWESWPGRRRRQQQQPGLSRHKEVSEWLGQVCSGHPADAPEAHHQEAQDPRWLCQEEAEISKVLFMIFFFIDFLICFCFLRRDMCQFYEIDAQTAVLHLRVNDWLNQCTQSVSRPTSSQTRQWGSGARLPLPADGETRPEMFPRRATRMKGTPGVTVWAWNVVAVSEPTKSVDERTGGPPRPSPPLQLSANLWLLRQEKLPHLCPPPPPKKRTTFKFFREMRRFKVAFV